MIDATSRLSGGLPNCRSAKLIRWAIKHRPAAGPESSTHPHQAGHGLIFAPNTRKSTQRKDTKLASTESHIPNNLPDLTPVEGDNGPQNAREGEGVGDTYLRMILDTSYFQTLHQPARDQFLRELAIFCFTPIDSDGVA